MFRETLSMARAYADARQHHGASELLAQKVAAAHREGGDEAVSEAEADAIESIRQALAT
jgi:hypothetical protein